MTRSLPSGYTVRPATIDDVERAAELVNLCSIDPTGRPATDADELRIDWLLPSSNPEKETLYEKELRPGVELATQSLPEADARE